MLYNGNGATAAVATAGSVVYMAAEGGGEEGEGGQLILTQGQVMEAMVGVTNNQQEGVMGFVAKYEVSTNPPPHEFMLKKKKLKMAHREPLILNTMR
jgi:hypothetical protein